MWFSSTAPRTSCLKRVHHDHLLAPGGVLFLHDADRPSQQEGLQLFSTWSYVRGSVPDEDSPGGEEGPTLPQVWSGASMQDVEAVFDRSCTSTSHRSRTTRPGDDGKVRRRGWGSGSTDVRALAQRPNRRGPEEHGLMSSVGSSSESPDARFAADRFWWVRLRVPTWRGIRSRAAKQGRAVERAVEQWIQSHRRGVHQLSHNTKEDRYPAIFDAVCGCLRSEGADGPLIRLFHR